MHPKIYINLEFPGTNWRHSLQSQTVHLPEHHWMQPTGSYICLAQNNRQASVAFHWCVGDHFDNLNALHEAYPDKQLLFSEGCQEGGPHNGEWGLGKRYGHSLFNDLNRWTVSWVDWNLLLDEQGSPNHVRNYCSAPILVDTRTGQPLYQSFYYYLGHFFRYIRPGAEHILRAGTADKLKTTVFINPDGIAVTVMNHTEKVIPFALKYNGSAACTSSLAHSIMTLRFDAFPNQN